MYRKGNLRRMLGNGKNLNRSILVQHASGDNAATSGVSDGVNDCTICESKANHENLTDPGDSRADVCSTSQANASYASEALEVASSLNTSDIQLNIDDLDTAAEIDLSVKPDQSAESWILFEKVPVKSPSNI
jgi:hypothetical protein